ncbi:hypothetical protein [Ectobacillus panaciterrae]|uniref:hypothetical protein n=1 Tax=Ectobacillus panaciterrae TaxID=363872 RepID=UPI0003FC3A33|nr:hypothetical protein [Ectobacillus panaciterrae]
MIMVCLKDVHLKDLRLNLVIGKAATAGKVYDVAQEEETGCLYFISDRGTRHYFFEKSEWLHEHFQLLGEIKV